jgi:diguanylate cyclase (GGDEF)-like protein
VEVQLASEPVVALAIIDALLVAMFFLFRVLPWSRSGPWRLIWMLSTLMAMLFILSELMAILQGGSAVSFEHQAPLFGAILAVTACFILVYLHGHRETEHAMTLALTDDLTQLLNSRAFDARLSVVFERRVPFGLLYIELSGVKQVTELFGYDRAELLMKNFANILRANITKDDAAARLGGTEFGVLLSGADEQTAQAVGQRIIAGLRTPALRELGALDIGASLGVATHEDATSSDQLLRMADRAMRRAKQDGSNRIGLARAR